MAVVDVSANAAAATLETSENFIMSPFWLRRPIGHPFFDIQPFSGSGTALCDTRNVGIYLRGTKPSNGLNRARLGRADNCVLANFVKKRLSAAVFETVLFKHSI